MKTPLGVRAPQRRTGLGLLVLLCLGVWPGCDESPTSPSGVAVVTFQVVAEQFRVRLTTEDQLQAARAAQAGGRAQIPVGRIVAGAGLNTGWSWHLEDLTFAEVAIEVLTACRLSRARRRPGLRAGNVLPEERPGVDIRTSP